MSRIGKKKIAIIPGTEVKIEGSRINVKGSLGELKRELHSGINIRIEGGSISITRDSDDNYIRSLHGLMRTEVYNMIYGVAKGFEKTLIMTGVGYRAQLDGRKLVLSLGYSHPVIYNLPDGIDVKLEKPTVIIIKGIDKRLVGQTSADIRDFRKSEPYKGRGIKYSDERIKRKEGKAGK
ncbi:MAG: 50S ribosomal protein L6 [Nitrospirota bacterium]